MCTFLFIWQPNRSSMVSCYAVVQVIYTNFGFYNKMHLRLRRVDAMLKQAFLLHSIGSSFWHGSVGPRPGLRFGGIAFVLIIRRAVYYNLGQVDPRRPGFMRSVNASPRPLPRSITVSGVSWIVLKTSRPYLVLVFSI